MNGRIRKIGSRYNIELDVTVDVGEVDTTVEINVEDHLADILDIIEREKPELFGEALGSGDVDPRVIIGYIRGAKSMYGTWEHEIKPMLLEAIES